MPAPGQDGTPPPALDPRVPRLVVIGNFDGVHLGHQAVLRTAAQKADERDLSLLVLTFDPHPSEVLGRTARAALTGTERKVRLLEAAVPGLTVYVKRFDLELAGLSPLEFAQKILRDELGAQAVVVGENFRFGRGRAGDLATLKALGRDLGFEAWAEALLGDDDGAFSSTRIRQLLSVGDVRGAAHILGRNHFLSGVVGRGDQRGRILGFPTANLSGVRQALPREGVYAVHVFDLTGPQVVHLAPGVANLGARPTVDRPSSLEVHLFDFDGDLYEKRVGVTLVDFIRPIEKFKDVEALKAQIEKDAQCAREISRGCPVEVPI